MSENSKIEWTDHTFNPWEGCQRVGPGCDHCYAETRNARFSGGTAINWGPGAPRRRTSAANWRKPLQWNKAHAEFYAVHGRRQRVFCASLADVFDNAVDPIWRRDLFDLIELTPNLNWLLLTKRIGNVFEMVARARSHDWLAGRDNVWLGATIVNQEEADRDIEKLLMTPARRRFVSIEPMLGPIDLQAWFDPTGMCCAQEMTSCEDCPACADWIHGPTTEYANDGSGYSSPTIDWVIVGGESGHGARPMHADWARQLRDQCAQYGVPFLFKQWGELLPSDTDGESYAVALDGSNREFDGTVHLIEDGGQQFFRIGKKIAGRQLDGRTHDEFPRGTR
ncbi:phage Gp37/Gp68 family protein [Paraburkholderia terrae]|uniref:phage Gp37/Gp68 family protein n=1 Tax=Paraburkholderia terrae TaxID=311230 RepID=UPI00296B316D|nr:phage Gp37/Gp68 family protein [Paraburkholderia terrae]MDW3655419.1 phage Gp37/Gp68 family protein [Paraburkholderia terrae]